MTIEAVNRLRKIGQAIAALSSEARDLRMTTVARLKAAQHPLPASLTDPPFQMLAGATLITVAYADGKDWNITYKDLPQLQELSDAATEETTDNHGSH